jgi:hypothetical protein
MFRVVGNERLIYEEGWTVGVKAVCLALLSFASRPVSLQPYKVWVYRFYCDQREPTYKQVLTDLQLTIKDTLRYNYLR